MNKLTTFLGNLPIYLGLILRKASDASIVIGLKFHVILNTKAGKDIKKFQQDMLANLQAMKANTPQTQVKQIDRNSKLSDIIKGKNGGTSNG